MKTTPFQWEISIRKFLSLKDLTSQVLHSLIEKITCNSQGEIRIHYNFVNPF
jgi:Domain of unknown function (DUF4368)